jgi:hypothetical protein
VIRPYAIDIAIVDGKPAPPASAAIRADGPTVIYGEASAALNPPRVAQAAE